MINLSSLKNFNLTNLRQNTTKIAGKLFDGIMLINDFESISILVGGDQDVYQEIAPIFEVFTDDSLYVGTVGSAQIGLQSLNVLQDQLKTGIQQALNIAQKPGVDLNAVLDLLADTDETEFIRHWGNQKLEQDLQNQNKSPL